MRKLLTIPLLFLISCVALAGSKPKFHYGDHVGFNGGEFYGDCEGIVVSRNHASTYTLKDVYCNGTAIDELHIHDEKDLILIHKAAE